jgi:hypothetical protein
VSVSGVQEALLGASASGGTLLFLRANWQCVWNGARSLLIADEIRPGSLDYHTQDLTGLPALAPLSRVEETITLSADGLTLIGVPSSGPSFLVSSRSAVGRTDFSALAVGPFAAVNASLPPSPAWVMWPILSADGLAFYYQIFGAADASRNGTYEALRPSTSVPFPAGTKMSPTVQAFDGVSGVSSDRRTLFVARSFGTTLLTRPSLSDPFSAPASSTPPGGAYRVVPVAGCSLLVGTCEPGGCQNEDICVWRAE